MQSQDLTTSSGSGSQTTTQSPQTSTQGNFGGTPSNNVQPDSTVNLFNDQTGISLTPSSPSTVNLSSSNNGSLQTSKAATQLTTTHHVSTVLLELTAGLIIVAVMLTWRFTKSANNTTHY